MAASEDFVKGRRRCIGVAEAGHTSCSFHLRQAGWTKCGDCGAWVPPVSALQLAVPAAVRCGCTKEPTP